MHHAHLLCYSYCRLPGCVTAGDCAWDGVCRPFGITQVQQPVVCPPAPQPQRRSWHNYSKRLAKVAVGVSKWVQKLQAYAVQQPESLVINAQRALEVWPDAWTGALLPCLPATLPDPLSRLPPPSRS